MSKIPENLRELLKKLPENTQDNIKQIFLVFKENKFRPLTHEEIANESKMEIKEVIATIEANPDFFACGPLSTKDPQKLEFRRTS